MLLNLIHATFFILVFDLIYAEYYTATDEVGHLLETRKRVINDVYFYIKTERKTLSILKRYLNLFKIEYEMLSQSVTNYLENPLNAFTLIKRLTADLKYVKNIIRIEKEHMSSVTKKHENLQYPTVEDLIGVVKGLATLEEVYNLDIKDFANGKLHDFVYSKAMTASDCYELARILFNELNPEAAITWMEEALYKYNDEEFPYLFNDIDIMEFISYGNHMLENLEIALQWTKKILNINPNHSRARNSLIRIRKEIDEKQTKEKVYPQEQSFEQDTEQDVEIEMKNAKYDQDSTEAYQAHCRGDIGITIQISSRLTCSYLTDNPYLKIAPFKTETLYVNPDVILFHGVLSDAEINRMKEISKPRLRRAVVQNTITGEIIPSDNRISKSATMLDTHSNLFSLISRRATHITGLSMEATGDIQIANYGVGGYYLPHHDFIQVTNDTYMKGGRRIATLLFYLSDVSRGGATVFPHLGVSVSPVKGTAIFWYNLYPSGEANHAMLHASCPVLRGSKWVATKWILQGGQELIKPCNLEYQREGINEKIPSPALRTMSLLGKEIQTEEQKQF